MFCESLTGELVTWFRGCFGLNPERTPLYAESGQQVPQPLVERVLRAHLASSPPVRMELGATVTAISDGPGSVRATIRRDTGAEHVVEASYLLGCDGPNGRHIGASYVGSFDPRPNFNLVFRAPGLTTPLGNAVQYWVVGGRTPGLLGRLDLDGTWWGIAPGVDRETGNVTAGTLITNLVGRPVEHELLSTDPWTARMLVAATFQRDRVVLVGESDAPQSASGGHGFNTCVGDAVTSPGSWPPYARFGPIASILASYQQERRSVVEQTVSSATRTMSARLTRRIDVGLSAKERCSARANHAAYR